MINGKRIIVVAALAALATFSFGQRGGFGFGGGGAMPVTFLLMRNDVRTDLKITDDQKSKLGDLQQSMMSKGREIRQNDQGDNDKMAADMKAFNEDMAKQVNEILTADQQTRLKEIQIQLTGSVSVMVIPEVAAAVKLTDDQTSKIKALQKTAADANAAVREKAQNGEIDRQDVFPAMQKNTAVLNDEIGKILTDDQKATLKKMGGAPFTADANPFGGGR